MEAYSRIGEKRMDGHPPANQEDPSLDVHHGSSHQQDPGSSVHHGSSHQQDPGSSDQQHQSLRNPSYLLVFPLPPSPEQPPSPPNFAVLMVFRQVEPSSIRLPIRPQVRVPSESQGLLPLSPHPVTIDISTSADVREEARQEEEARRQVEETANPPAPVQQQDQQEEAPRVEETADTPATVEEQNQLPVPLRPVIPDFFRFPGIPGQLHIIKTGSDFGTKLSKVYCPYSNTYLASFRGVGDGGASTSGMENGTNVTNARNVTLQEENEEEQGEGTSENE
nr:hypothetical protein Iba_chr10aCG15550 [Ipomoea batatas]